MLSPRTRGFAPHAGRGEARPDVGWCRVPPSTAERGPVSAPRRVRRHSPTATGTTSPFPTRSLHGIRGFPKPRFGSRCSRRRPGGDCVQDARAAPGSLGLEQSTVSDATASPQPAEDGWQPAYCSPTASGKIPASGEWNGNFVIFIFR